MARRENIIGYKFNRLTVIRENGRDSGGHMLYLCECNCGNQISAPLSRLKSGNTKSCGCFRKENTHNMRIKHGMKGTRLYRIWRSMKDRCYNPNFKDYSLYGGRGITVCQEWLNDFSAFYDWAVTHGYADNLSIDRMDNDKGYSPDNCRWATALEQRLNQRRCKHD